jgi:hypothetical protein
MMESQPLQDPTAESHGAAADAGAPPAVVTTTSLSFLPSYCCFLLACLLGVWGGRAELAQQPCPDPGSDWILPR